MKKTKKLNDEDIKKAKKVFKNPKSSHWAKCEALMAIVERDLQDHDHY